ncbi:MAG: zinc ribbon domain-containing protein [Rhodospirillales bacterium]|jgi:putative FmdB family regulatory protein|nr:FmdB family transcriptional regulator [Rhodospirillaceae bacterium]MDP6430501.1 zinc ribbon domain-containing protein [Rhodospirillales bacterium]MDP6644982.1 zinc ribbon domain-containing protein [Rhodospirillales bacterium]MDP6840652.1 zinc ribbon domain-containing protein [Rhodospirillales bacterium]|tara:strand:+ start:2289 stop:2510 length:222 start_codon:yes stop_codon:yes gene_type:complete
MPYFNYSCDDCGEAFEALTHSDGADVDCPACSSGKVAKQVGSRVAIRTSASNTGKVMDLSSGNCPGCAHHHHH